MEKSFEVFKTKFSDFYTAVKKGHGNSSRSHRGHGLDHDVTVAQIALKIAPDSRTAKKAWCAAMLHSTDRLIGKGKKKQEEVYMKNCLARLPQKYFTLEEIEEIFQAAYRHEELNQGDQSLTQQVLMDADRLSNLMLTIVIRAGQFRPEIPPLEFRYLIGKGNPLSDHYHPQSILDDIRNSITEQASQIRIPKAKKLAERYSGPLELYIYMVMEEYKGLGLIGISL